MIAVAVGDPEATRTVYAVVIALAAIGVVLIIVAVWLVRQTRVDPELLAPLERMDTRRWERRDPATQRRMLDEVRPEGAEPLHRERAAPAVDEEFEAELPAAAGFDDLKDGAGVVPVADGSSSDESADEEPAATEKDASADGASPDEAAVAAPETGDDGSPDEAAVAAPESGDDGSPDEATVAAPETGDDGSPDEATVAPPETGDDGSPDQATVAAEGTDEESATENDDVIGDGAEGDTRDPDNRAEVEDAADPDDGPAATSGDDAAAEECTDADGEHVGPAGGAADAGHVGDGAGDTDAEAASSDAVDGPVAEAPEDPDDSRRSAVVSAQD